MITADDYNSFCKINNINHWVHGSCNIWMCDSKKDYGFKIFFTFGRGPAIFFTSMKIGNKRLVWGFDDCNCRSCKNIEENWMASWRVNHPFSVFDKEEMEDMFQVTQIFYKLDYHPKPFELIEHGSLCAIKIQKVNQFTGQRGNNYHNGRADLFSIDSTELKKYFDDDYVNGWDDPGTRPAPYGGPPRRSEIGNFGTIGDKVVTLDVDYHELTAYRKKKKEKSVFR
ncbi:MAG: hypothetical protein QGH83_08450 [Candidatus Pacebacteria bacterium]|jgi:hypothetical protein|nr:hypothetical protein [Candidatus Paceibacterota bacterium]